MLLYMSVVLVVVGFLAFMVFATNCHPALFGYFASTKDCNLWAGESAGCGGGGLGFRFKSVYQAGLVFTLLLRKRGTFASTNNWSFLFARDLLEIGRCGCNLEDNRFIGDSAVCWIAAPHIEQ